jgi:hypothetical protein
MDGKEKKRINVNENRREIKKNERNVEHKR